MALHDKMEQAWEMAWTRFFRAETNLFYDGISSKDPAHSQDHLPTAEEVGRQYPNVCGWGTGMEDSAISAGVWMAAVCDRFDATGDWGVKAYADKVWDGMARLAAIARSPGFIPRSACLEDGASHYINSSRDQYTHYVHGLWRFYHSPLSDAPQREAMRKIITDICARMEKNVVAENDYSFCREDGKPGVVDKMWEVWCHEWARLPMIYMVGWDVTQDRHWHDLYRRYAWKAARESVTSPIWFRVAYAYMQAVFSLEPLVALERDDANLRSAWVKAMHFYADRMEGFSWTCLNAYRPLNLADYDLDWRHWERQPMEDGSGFSVLFPANVAWDYAKDRSAGEGEWIREPAEALLSQLMVPDRPLSADQKDLLLHLLHQTDYDACITYALFFAIAAYWRAVKQGVLPGVVARIKTDGVPTVGANLCVRPLESGEHIGSPLRHDTHLREICPTPVL
ncbi:MAG: hypothetical protein FWF84_07555, partial [Kiritimatiellaeota bacterium]|nr:hypothetical protein [Kiritimatiellota bacterium]